MNLATGAMGSLLPKLLELLKEEYKLKKKVREGVESLEKEMKSMYTALRKVGEVPRDQLDEQVKFWADEVRELSFNMEDVVDKFLVRVEDGSEPAANSNKIKRLTKKMAGLFIKGKTHHEIANAIKDINKQVQEVASRRVRYNVDNLVAMPAAVAPIDPRLRALYTEVTELVGIAGKRDQELMKLLSEGDNESKKKLKTVSVVGFGGLGKTTLVKTVYDKIKGEFDCRAFVSVGRNASAKKILMDILLALDMYESHFTILGETQLIDKLRERLENKRYLIVIDDIWDEKLWTIINWAFSKNNNFGSRLITTTRIVNVSKFCCSSTNDSVYQMEPLSDDDSKRLFYKRIFSQESGCPRELEEVSTCILKKCGGVPLAIITIASLLASDQHPKPEDEWHVLLESIGRGLTKDHGVEEMMRILSISYYDLPSYLRTCLLYLSMFPEDREIMKDQLIWMWIAESFVQCEKAKTSLFEIGETYFNELVNRSLIQPVYNYRGFVYACRVHDSVLDLICSLSREESFVTILNGTDDGISSQRNVRKLSLQNTIKEHQTMPLISKSILQVRSIATFKSAIGLLPPLSSFVVLRVLDLTGCNVGDHSHLNLQDLGTLFHLRYLGLADIGISEVPEVGKLQFLQVLDLSGNYDIRELPSSVTRLRRLMCLLTEPLWNLPDGLGKLTSMEVLGEICGDSLCTVKALGNMKALRKLQIKFNDLSMELEEAFVESLEELSNIQSLEIDASGASMDLLGERWVPPRSLREFIADRHGIFSMLPAWIRRNPAHLSQLHELHIWVEEVRQKDLGFLGKLSALHSLTLRTTRQRQLFFGADGFRCLTTIVLVCRSPGRIMFRPGALPRAETVKFEIRLRVAKEEAASSGGDWLDLGMEYLVSLRKVHVRFYTSGVMVGEVKQARASLENTLHAHPNRPVFGVFFIPDIVHGTSDDDTFV
ncbi:disease resistance protein RGA5-like [Triticum aestivum]|nr:disease resistance protein RGA5-like [Triticum aestivum]